MTSRGRLEEGAHVDYTRMSGDTEPDQSYVLCSSCLRRGQQLIDVLLQHETGEYTCQRVR